MKYTLILFIFLFNIAKGQKHLYYKVITEATIADFKSDSSKIFIEENDSLYKYKAIFDYVSKMFPNISYKKITVKSTTSNKLYNVKSKGAAAIKADNQREYTIQISMHAPSHLDTATFDKLSFNAKVGMVAKQFGLIKEYSTSNFFQVMGLYFKKKSSSKSKRLNKDVNLYAIEAGLGYQLMSLTNETLDKLLIDFWRNKKEYKRYYNKSTKHLMSADAIETYMADYAIYQLNQFK